MFKSSGFIISIAIINNETKVELDYVNNRQYLLQKVKKYRRLKRKYYNQER
jgi:ribosomal protein S8